MQNSPFEQGAPSCPSIPVRRAYCFMGAHKSGDNIIFRCYAPAADAVFVTGDFNGWDESLTMRRVGDGWIWETSVCSEKIHLGNGYKYKIYRGGQAEYLTDPYSEHIGDGPYYNSVIVDESYEWTDGEWMQRRREEQKLNVKRPISIYLADVLGWKKGRNAVPLPLGELAEELIPYLKQMGYTHLCLYNVLDECDGDGIRHAHTFFAQKKELGEACELKSFVDRLHVDGIGVMLELDAGAYDNTELLVESIGYWTDLYHIDGAVISAERSVSGVMDDVRRIYADVLIVDGRAERDDVPYAIPKQYLGDEWHQFAAIRAKKAYETVTAAVKLTVMGDELGAGSVQDGDGGLDWSLMNRDINARLQLCFSELNAMYISCPQLWGGVTDGQIEPDEYREGVMVVRRRSFDGRELCAVVNLSPNVYRSVDLRVEGQEYREIFNSDRKVYGGSGVTNEGRLFSCDTSLRQGKTVRIDVPPMAVTVIEPTDN